MKNKAINTLTYCGTVTVSQQTGKKRRTLLQQHNSGGQALFEFLASCLIGDFTYAKANMPVKVKLLDKSGNTYTPVSGFKYLLTDPEKVYSSSQTKVRYSFMIPKDQIEQIKNYSNLWIGLYTDSIRDTELTEYVAICELSGLNVSTLVNAALVIDWELVISNNNV